MTIQEIEQAITELSPEELAHFREWFEEFDAQVWDEQFERDARSGKLDNLTRNPISRQVKPKSYEAFCQSILLGSL